MNPDTEQHGYHARHRIVIASWEQGRRKGEPYERLYEARCDPCRWLSQHTANAWQARLWADKHAGVDRTAPDWARGKGVQPSTPG